jgi:hypothetical protein
MANPIQDWLDKVSKPNQTVSGNASADANAKPAAAGKAGVGAKPAVPSSASTSPSQVSDEFLKQNPLQQQKAAMALKTNQDVINAAYKVAEELKLEGGPWPLLRAAGWGHLTDNRGDHYKGPAIDEIEKLTP